MLSSDHHRPGSGGFNRHNIHGTSKSHQQSALHQQQQPQQQQSAQSNATHHQQKASFSMPANPSSTSSATPLKSSYVAPKRGTGLSQHLHSNSNQNAASVAIPPSASSAITFERQPAPALTSSIAAAAASPFVYHTSTASSTNSSNNRPPSAAAISAATVHQSSSLAPQQQQHHPHAVKLPRDAPNLPKGLQQHHMHSRPTAAGTTSSSFATISSITPTPSAVPASGNSADMHSIEKAMLQDIGYFRDTNRSTVTMTVEQLLKEKREEKEKLEKKRVREMGVINSILSGGTTSNATVSVVNNTFSVASTSSTSTTPIVTDASLITSLTQRLTTLEKIASKQAKAVSSRDTMIADLQSKLRATEKSQDAEKMYELQTELQGSRKEVEEYKRQVREMESFLNDYGLVWVGFRADAAAAATDNKEGGEEEEEKREEPDAERVDDEAQDSTAPNPTTAASSSPTTTSLSSEIYFSVSTFLSCVSELNSLASDGASMRIHTTAAGVTKFLPPIMLDLILYKDGMYFMSGPLRKWSTSAAREFVRDVMEGYFPYELKEQYPDGVGLAVVDRSKVYCQQERERNGSDNTSAANVKFTAFGGKGMRLEDGKIVEGSPSASPITPSSETPTTTTTTFPSRPTLSSSAPPHVPLEAYLAKLPEKVLKDGKLIEVRNEIAAMLGGGSGQKGSGGGGSNNLNVSPSPPPQSISPSIGKINANAVLIDTPALKILQTRESAAASPNPEFSAQPSIATLQIKFDPIENHPPILLKLFYHTTIKEVRDYIDEVRTKYATTSGTITTVSSAPLGYDLRTTYPPYIYGSDTDSRTLLEVGLTPNANMFLRNRRPASAGYREHRLQMVEQPKPDESWCVADE